MPQFVRLSYEIRPDGPGWPGNPTYRWEQISSIAGGDVANLGVLHLCDHFGSHLDAPNHFNDDGLKMLVEAMCTTCHVIGDKHIAPPGLAPELSTIGAIATPSYLRESITSPSAIIVPNPNANQHYNRTLPADAYGAYPNNDQFVWYARDAKGKKVSRMPPFGLPPADVAAMVTYLRTLGRNP